MEEVKNTFNKYIEYIKANRNNFYIIGAIVLLFLLSSGLIALIAGRSKTPSTNPSTVNTNPSQSASQLSPSTTNPQPTLDGPIVTPAPTEAAMIENQTQPQITPNVAVPYTVANITKYGNTWATMQITNPDVGNGGLILQKVNGIWKVVLGPGSYFTPDQLQSLGAPQELIDSFNQSPSTSPSPSSSSTDVQ